MAYSVKVTGQYDTVNRTADGDEIGCGAVDTLLQAGVADLDEACAVMLANAHRQRYSPSGFSEVEVVDADGARVAWIDAQGQVARAEDLPARPAP